MTTVKIIQTFNDNGELIKTERLDAIVSDEDTIELSLIDEAAEVSKNETL